MLLRKVIIATTPMLLLIGCNNSENTDAPTPDDGIPGVHDDVVHYLRNSKGFEDSEIETLCKHSHSQSYTKECAMHNEKIHVELFKSWEIEKSGDSGMYGRSTVTQHLTQELVFSESLEQIRMVSTTKGSGNNAFNRTVLRDADEHLSGVSFVSEDGNAVLYPEEVIQGDDNDTDTVQLTLNNLENLELLDKITFASGNNEVIHYSATVPGSPTAEIKSYVDLGVVLIEHASLISKIANY